MTRDRGGAEGGVMEKNMEAEWSVEKVENEIDILNETQVKACLHFLLAGDFVSYGTMADAIRLAQRVRGE